MAQADTTRQTMVNRPAAAAPVAVAQVVAARTLQTKSELRISSPKDPAEKEAEGTAKKIMRMVAPSVQRFGAAISLMQNGSGSLSRKGEGPATASNSVAAEISNQKSAGSPLPAPVRGFMESRFRADFGGVRVHTGPNAASLARRVNAQAFTVGNNVFFGRDQWRPDTSEGKELLAHELTHTIQQGSAVQRKEGPAVSERVNGPEVQRLGISDALDYFADKANLIPGFRMFTIILGVNPINMSRVERSAANILRAAIEMIPGGGLIRMALDNYGVFDRAGAWVEEQIRTLGMTGGVIRDAINRFLDSLSWRDIFNLGGVWNRAKRIFTEPIDRIVSFLGGLVTGIIKLVKDAILRPLAGLASRTRAWDLLKAVLGQDPITGDPVPRTAETLIGGFMKLIGQEEIWQNIQKANAIPRAWAWFQNALNGLMALVRSIPGRFIEAFRSLTLSDIVALPTAFGRIVGVFGSFILDFLSWAGNTVWDLLQIIFAVVAPGVMPYLQKAAATFRTILKDPIGFVGNLVRAVMLGFRQFSTNILRHLSAALIGWLTGALSGANIYIPQALNLQELIKFVLSVLGLTWQNIRQKLVRVVGETAVGAMETGFDIVVVLVRQGPAAAWEKIKESLSNLRDMVIEQIMEFVKSRIVTAAITRLVSMLSPAGAFIQAIIAIYNTVMFVVERLRQIAQVVASIIDSIAAIAAGQVTAAANRVEQTMGGLLTLVISFLARLVGLGRVSDAVTNVVNRVRAPIDRALDRVVDWIVQQARRLGRFLTGQGTAQQAPAAGAPGATDADTIVETVAMKGATHTIRVKPNRKEITLATQEGRAEQKVTQAETQVRSLPQNAQAQDALRIQSQIRAVLDRIYGFINRGEAGFRPHLREMNRLVQDLKGLLRAYGERMSVEDILVPLTGFGPATGGRHTAVTLVNGAPKQGLEPDGSARESHHVPAKELAKTLVEQLGAKARELNRTTTGKSAALALRRRVQGMRVTDDGAGLSAISLHRVTHQNSGGAAVHAAASAQDIIDAVARLDAEHNTQTTVVKNRVTNTLAVNPGGETWETWLRDVVRAVEARRDAAQAAAARTATTQARTEVASDLAAKDEAATRAVTDLMEDVIETAFTQAFQQGFAAVQNALNSSVLDGTSAERGSALTWLRTNARVTWQERGILKPR